MFSTLLTDPLKYLSLIHKGRSFSLWTPDLMIKLPCSPVFFIEAKTENSPAPPPPQKGNKSNTNSPVIQKFEAISEMFN